jgi:hypothetical protein
VTSPRTQHVDLKQRADVAIEIFTLLNKYFFHSNAHNNKVAKNSIAMLKVLETSRPGEIRTHDEWFTFDAKRSSFNMSLALVVLFLPPASVFHQIRPFAQLKFNHFGQFG